jgi:hypothetical protein
VLHKLTAKFGCDVDVRMRYHLRGTWGDAATIYRDTGDRHREGMALSNLGTTLQQAGRLDEAITACQDAAAICRQTGDEHKATSTRSASRWKAWRKPGPRSGSNSARALVSRGARLWCFCHVRATECHR